ncbi:TPA_asm: lipopolysaccharide glucosyltransferase RfaJ [Salmonella enterica subsp. enterica serovar Typhimurium]|nr:lipopolysaccharide 1,2-glucosyltransferase RfaJ [Salmonella enterica subsp. enterica serovar Typhimurium]HAB6879007.1 lipopolysaccharide glucosyltransferase RfaJ [Salmonella enterica subsp. enterica serovar Typhimurium]HBZ7149292.1 lipopolysaccharide 1,2-glucosyltransferase RfaJ [Salmonella enterica subsp. enterica serovar Typhimurium]HBZ7151260.1 lipopolysaccharide 1,2-glucosyltransferase RfaJ [Salmonella enterica subsp. enterica serovar Typhimurium]HCO8781063.1 lipopolysaccharide 1,2-gluco
MDSFPEIEIAEYKVFDESNNNDDNVLNISYGVDENYLDGVGVSIASVVLNNNIPLAFHIICDSYSPCFVKYIERLAVQHHIKISLYLIKVESLEVLPQTKVWSRAMYFRLFAFDYLSKKVNTLLYLDADVVCKGSLQDLLQLDLTEKIAAVVKDVDSIQNKVNERLSAFNLQGGYFNSGVVFVNLKLWKENALTKKAFLLLAGKEADSFKYPDQDVLNILLQDKVIFLPRPYNTILIHYTGATKPWHAWANYPSVIYYKNARLNSPWKDFPAKDARTIVEFKKRYKHLLVQGHYFKGLLAGSAYLYRKLFHK